MSNEFSQAELSEIIFDLSKLEIQVLDTIAEYMTDGIYQPYSGCYLHCFDLGEDVANSTLGSLIKKGLVKMHDHEIFEGYNCVVSNLTKKGADLKTLLELKEGTHTCEDYTWIEYDAQNIPLCQVCDVCRDFRLSKYRPEILTGYDQSDVNEPIEPE